MAGTTLDRQLTTAGTARVPFALATPADDADIRRLLRENPMPGQITLTLEREPDYFADAGLPGTEKQTIVANEGGRVVCMGNCSIRERFVNGQPRRVGYLGGLRLDARAAGRFDILRRGYEFFRELQADRPADFYFTSIAADNAPARKFLERGLPGMPNLRIHRRIRDGVAANRKVGLQITLNRRPTLWISANCLNAWTNMAAIINSHRVGQGSNCPHFNHST